MGALAVEVILGFLTFTASLMAFGKLQETPAPAAHHLPGPERRQPRASWLAAAAIGVYLVVHPGSLGLFLLMCGLWPWSSACC